MYRVEHYVLPVCCFDPLVKWVKRGTVMGNIPANAETETLRHMLYKQPFRCLYSLCESCVGYELSAIQGSSFQVARPV